MENFLNKHAAKLKSAALILMLAIPFLLYAAADKGSILQVKILIGCFMLNMLYVMKNG
jgi:hypothetical protein